MARLAKSSDRSSFLANRSGRFFSLLLILFSTLPGILATRAETYAVRAWTEEDGLPQRTVTCALQTRDGFLWAGTFNGLARFDGFQFASFTSVNTPAFRSDWINYLCEASDGSLWAGTQSGLVRMEKGEFHRVTVSERLNDAKVFRVIEPSPGVIIAGTDRGVFRWQNGAVTELPAPHPGWPNRPCWVFTDAAGHITAADQFEWHRWRDGKPELIARFEEGIHAMWRLEDGTWWIALSNNTLLRQAADGATQRFSIPDGNISSLFHDSKGRLWMATRSTGLYHWKNDQLERVATAPNPVGSRVLAITGDRDGNIWAGCDGEGLFRLRETPLTVHGEAEGMGHDDVASLAEGPDGRIWAGAFEGGLSFFQDGAWQRMSGETLPPDASVTALCFARNGTLWIGCGSDWFLRSLRAAGLRQGRAYDVIRALFQDRDEQLWIGTDTQGLILRHREMKEGLSITNGLSNNSVRAIAQDKSGALWVGTAEGLNRIQNGKVEQFHMKDGLGANFINSLHIDADDTLWIATAGGGLTRHREGVFATITTERGLFSDKIMQLIEDDWGNLWSGSDLGIFKVNKRLLHEALDGKSPSIICTAFGRAAGLRRPGCAGGFQSSCVKDRQGRLWFSTAGGAVMADPRHIQPRASGPPVRIEAALIDGMEVPLKSGPPLQVLPGRHRIEIHYAGLDLSAGEQVHFKYQLAGYDDWQSVGSRRAAYYSGVPPGEYEFRVMAANNDGVWNEIPARLTMVFQPYFWQALWFPPVAILVLAAALLAAWRLRLRNERRIAEMRLRIARDLHDEVGSNLSNIALLSQLAQSPGAGEELRDIRRVALGTVSAVRDVVWFINPEFDTVGEMFRHFEAVASRLGAGRRIVFDAAAPRLDQTLSIGFRRNVFLAFKEMMSNAAKHSGASRVEVSLKVENDILAMQVKDNGAGFDPAAVAPRTGLNSLRGRAEELRGSLEITSQPGQGASILLRAPVA